MLRSAGPPAARAHAPRHRARVGRTADGLECPGGDGLYHYISGKIWGCFRIETNLRWMADHILEELVIPGYHYQITIFIHSHWFIVPLSTRFPFMFDPPGCQQAVRCVAPL